MLPLTSVADAAPPAPSPCLQPGSDVATDPTAVLSHWMATAADGDLQPRLLRLADGRILPLPVGRWTGPVGAADESMLSRARGPVLDIGCGPGRLTAALHVRGTEVLGLELMPDVPVLARAAGAPVLLGDVFGPVPDPGAWQCVLLADGNVGIGGDPVRLLRRVRALLAPGGQLLCELHPDADTAGSGQVRLEGLGATSDWFRWTLLDAAGLSRAAAPAGLRVTEAWEQDGRLFVALTTT